MSALTPSQVVSFNRDGYLAPLPVLGEAETEQYYRAFTAICEQVTASGAPALIQAHLHFRSAYALATHPRLLDLVAPLIGPDILVHTTSLFLKRAGEASFVSWHQDGNPWRMSAPRVVSAWVALTDSARENGCLRVVPGTHREDAAHCFQRHPDNLLASGLTVTEPVDEAAAVDIELDRGCCSLHHMRLIHGSSPNESGRDRMGFAIRFLPVGISQALPHHDVVLARGRDEHGFYTHLDKPPRDDTEGLASHAAFARHVQRVRLGVGDGR